MIANKSNIQFPTFEELEQYGFTPVGIREALRVRDTYINELEQFKAKYQFKEHYHQLHCFLFEMDFCGITELIGEEFHQKLTFKHKDERFVLECLLVAGEEVYKVKNIRETDYIVTCGFDSIFNELETLRYFESRRELLHHLRMTERRKKEAKEAAAEMGYGKGVAEE